MQTFSWTQDEINILATITDRETGWHRRAVALLPGRSCEAIRDKVRNQQLREEMGEAEDRSMMRWNVSIMDEEEHLARINEMGGFPRFADDPRTGLMTGRRVTAEGRRWAT